MNGLEMDGVFSRRAGLPQNPDFSGFTSRKIWIPALPGLAGPHLPEDALFRDLLIRISRNMPSCRTCWFASPGICPLAGLAGPHLPEYAVFPDLLVRISPEDALLQDLLILTFR